MFESALAVLVASEAFSAGALLSLDAALELAAESLAGAVVVAEELTVEAASGVVSLGASSLWVIPLPALSAAYAATGAN